MDYLNFVPGPSKVGQEVKKDLQKAIKDDILSLSHRSEDFYSIMRETQKDLRKLLDIPENYSIYFVSSATECMEILCRNCASRDTFHFVFGAFSKRFHSIYQKTGRNAKSREIPAGEGYDFSQEEIKNENQPEMIAITHTETPTGVGLREEELGIFRQKYPDILMAVDIVSSAGTKKIDLRLADAWFFSVQKGFGLPAGLGVLIVNERVREKACRLREQSVDIGGFHSICDLDEAMQKYRTIETPNVLGIYLLGKQIRRFLEKGLKKIEEETRAKADFLRAWAKINGLKLCARDKRYRADSVLCLEFPDGIKAEFFHDALKKKNIFVGSGYKEMKETHFRLANFPSHTMEEMEAVTREIEKILKSR